MRSKLSLYGNFQIYPYRLDLLYGKEDLVHFALKCSGAKLRSNLEGCTQNHLPEREAAMKYIPSTVLFELFFYG